MSRLIIERVKLADRTLGSMYWDGEMIGKSFELPWKDNKRSISCIPNGIYPVTKEKPIPADDPATPVDESGGRKPRDYWHFRVHNVPKRQGILMHPGADVKHSLGCILPGSRFDNVNTDKPTLGGSVAKLKWMVDNLPNGFELEIRDKA